MSGHFAMSQTSIAGITVLERRRLGDHRGFFSRLFCGDELAAAGWIKPVQQINQTYTAVKGTVRGMHFQRPPMTEIKLVMCIRGSICDVAVDLRCGSPTFLKHHTEILSADNNRAILIPECCAHGFQALTDDVELIYLHSQKYHRPSEGGLSPVDPRLNINWPLAITAMSERDRSHPAITGEFEGMKL